MRLAEVLHGCLSEDADSDQVGYVGVHAETLRLISIHERSLVGQRCLAGFEVVHLGLSPTMLDQKDAAYSALRQLVRKVVDALHEVVKWGHQLGEVWDRLLEPL